MRAIGVDHVGVHVTSLERAIGFYESVFGFRLVERLTLGNEELAFLELDGARVELIADGSERSETGVVDHLALEVNDLDSWTAWLTEYGVRLLDHQPMEVAALDARIQFCLGPDGERIELFESHR